MERGLEGGSGSLQEQAVIELNRTVIGVCMCVRVCVVCVLCVMREDQWFPSVPSKTTTQRSHYIASWIKGEREGEADTGKRKRDAWKEI